MPLTNSLYVRVAALLAAALVAYPQFVAPAGSEVRPNDLPILFFYYRLPAFMVGSIIGFICY